jgi:ABC-type nitrate/sulfonate/bicarbonate transport system substrate-binding protein
MSFSKLTVVYGFLEGTAGRFARDPSGYLSIEAGIFRQHGLEVSWQHLQGTEQRYRELEQHTAHISLVVGRASLQHFLRTRRTRILGCAMNSCPYYLLAQPVVEEIRHLKGVTVACREAPSRNVALDDVFKTVGGLNVGGDLRLQWADSDQETFEWLLDGQVDAALLPRPYGFLAEEKGFKRIPRWPDVVDDPLPITIETTEEILDTRKNDLLAFLAAHREGIFYMKTHRAECMRMLQNQFGHSPSLAEKTFDQYINCMNEHLRVEFKQLEKLLDQVAPAVSASARQVAVDWILPGAVSG